MYLMPNARVGVSKKCNAERHVITMHKDLISKYRDNARFLETQLRI
jgi:hypothetical protein